MQLPQEFIEYTSALFGVERWQRFLQALNQIPVTSIRFNPWKYNQENIFLDAEAVPWCRQAQARRTALRQGR